MAAKDTCVTIVPYFKVNSGKMNDFKKICEQFIEKTKTEKSCLYYGFSFCGEVAHCREGYKDAESLLTHLENVKTELNESLKISDLQTLEIHGIESELAKLRGPLAGLNPRFFTLECGFRN